MCWSWTWKSKAHCQRCSCSQPALTACSSSFSFGFHHLQYPLGAQPQTQVASPQKFHHELHSWSGAKWQASPRREYGWNRHPCYGDHDGSTNQFVYVNKNWLFHSIHQHLTSPASSSSRMTVASSTGLSTKGRLWRWLGNVLRSMITTVFMLTLKENQRPSASLVISFASLEWCTMQEGTWWQGDQPGTQCFQESAPFLHSPLPKLNLMSGWHGVEISCLIMRWVDMKNGLNMVWHKKGTKWMNLMTTCKNLMGAFQSNK